MKTKFILIYTLFFCSFYCFSQQWQWTKSNFSKSTYCNTRVSLSNGDIIGTFDNTITKYDPNGNLLWNVNITNIFINDLCSNNLGDFYITGTFTGTAVFGNQTITSTGLKDVLIGKFDSNGNCQWVHSFGSISNDIGNAVSIDVSGNVVLTGEFRDSITVGTQNLVSNNPNQSFFIVKYGTSGQVLWANQSMGWGYGLKVKCDSLNNTYALGTFGQTTSFNNHSVAGASYGNTLILIKYDNQGNVAWAKTLASSAVQSMNVLDASLCSDIYIGLNGGYGASGICKYDNNGNLIWTKNIGYSSYGMSLRAISIDTNGDIFTCGSFGFNGLFCGNNLPGGLFLNKWDSNGNCQWTANAVASSGISGEDIELGAGGLIYLSGYFADTAKIGSDHFTTQQPYNFFVSKLSETLITDLKKNDKKIIENLNVFPNPSQGIFEIELNSYSFKSGLNIKVLNSLGSIVHFENVLELTENPTKTLKLNHLNPGVYFVYVQNGEYIETKKIIIQ